MSSCSSIDGSSHGHPQGCLFVGDCPLNGIHVLAILQKETVEAFSRIDFEERMFPLLYARQHVVNDNMIYSLYEVNLASIFLLRVSEEEEKSSDARSEAKSNTNDLETKQENPRINSKLIVWDIH